MDLTQLFCDIDDFVNSLIVTKKIQKITGKCSRGKDCRMSLSEIMTIIVLYHSC